MRKILIVSIVVFAVVAAASVAITWFLQASALRGNLERAIADVNAQQTYITYDAIETSGFPSEMKVTLLRPRFTGRADQLLAAMRPAGSAPTPEWSEDIALDGAITLGINTLSSRYTLTARGNWESRGAVGGQPVHLASQSPINISCVLEIGGNEGMFGALWNFGVIAQQPDLLSNLRRLDCTSPGYSIADADSKTVLFASGPQRVSITSQPTGDQTQARFFAKSENAEVTAAGDAVADAYMNALAAGYPLSTRPSDYGKQTMEMDVSYSGPITFPSDPVKAPVDINISKLDIANQIYNSSNAFHFAHALRENNHDVKLTLRSESSFTEAYDAMLQETIKRFIANATVQPGPMQASMQKHTPEEWQAVLSPALPNFHSLGKTALRLDMDLHADQSLTAGDLALSTLEISAAPYGITGSGTAKLLTGQILPAANVTLICANCLRLVDDVTAYWNRANKALSELRDASSPPQPIDPKLVEGWKMLLSALAETTAEDKTTFRFAFISDGASNMTLNGKRPDEVMKLYNQYAAPVKTQPQTPDSAPAQ